MVRAGGEGQIGESEMKELVVTVAIALMNPALAWAGMSDHVNRKKIDGIDVIGYPTAIKDVVTIEGSLPAGDVFAVAEHDNVAAAALTAMMLDRGTTKEDKIAIARKLKGVGASLRFSAESQSLRIFAQCLKKDLPLVIDLIAEQLRTPAFSQSEFDKVRQQFIGRFKNANDDVQQRSAEAFNRAVFPARHPNHEPSFDEYLGAAQTLTLEEVKSFHRKYYGPDHMTLVLVGDVDIARAQGAVAGAFRGWKGGVDYLRYPKPATSTEPQNHSVLVEMPGKSSAVLSIGQATGLRDKDPDTVPLEVGTAILGRGFTGRLMHAVRDTEGLTYGIGAGLKNNTFADGSWQITGTFAPQLIDRGTASTQRELQRWWTDGVTDQELVMRKRNLIGTYQVGLSNTEGMATALLSSVLKGHDVTWLDQYPKAVGAVTLQQVNAAIKGHLNPENMVVVRTGPAPTS
jgi:zinc protease